VGASLTAGPGLLASAATTTASGDSIGDGVNVQPSYFCDGDPDIGWDLMDEQSDIDTVRIEIEPPSWGETEADRAAIRGWIDDATDHGLDVIGTVHHYPNNGSSDRQDLLDAAQWWVDNYSYLSANSSFTINLHNEWGNHETTREEYADAYNEALSMVRSGTDYSGPIVIDIPGWGQEFQVAADAAASLDDDALVLSGHLYPSAWNGDQGRWVQPEDLEYMHEQTDYPCLIGEFGSRADGQADWSALVDTATSLGWPVIGWAWNGDGGYDSDDDGEKEPETRMNMVSPYWGDDCGRSSYSKSDYFSVVYEKLGEADPEQEPYNGPHELPGRVEAEDFDTGGNGVAYDETDGNVYDAYRPEERVDIESASDGDYNIGSIDSGEWWEYTVEVADAGTYEFVASVASESGYGGGELRLECQGEQIAADFEATGGWYSWTTVTVGELALEAGPTVVRIESDAADWNLDWFEATTDAGGDGDNDDDSGGGDSEDDGGGGGSDDDGSGGDGGGGESGGGGSDDDGGGSDDGNDGTDDGDGGSGSGGGGSGGGSDSSGSDGRSGGGSDSSGSDGRSGGGSDSSGSDSGSGGGSDGGSGSSGGSGSGGTDHDDEDNDGGATPFGDDPFDDALYDDLFGSLLDWGPFEDLFPEVRRR
jgi:hypothetical protein